MIAPRLFAIGVGWLLLAGCGGSAVRDNGASSAAGGGNAPSATAGSGGENDVPSAGRASGGDAGLAGAAAGGSPAVCPPGVPSAQQIASTPRANPNLELLALKLSTGIVADQAIYDRVVRDVSAIQTQDSTVAGIGYFPRNDGRSLELSVDQPTFDQMRDHSYQAWDCLNQAYILGNVNFGPGTLLDVSLSLKGIYELQQVAAEYATLAGIKSAGPGGIGGGDGPTICVTPEGDVWHYVFDQAGGDCTAGCNEHQYFHFTTGSAGAVTNLGQLSPELVSMYASWEACH
jgi:hypothetical protein